MSRRPDLDIVDCGGDDNGIRFEESRVGQRGLCGERFENLEQKTKSKIRLDMIVDEHVPTTQRIVDTQR